MRGGPTDPSLPSWEFWLLESPLSILGAGPSAVIVFFVLSGYVLALLFLVNGSFRARQYYLRRMARLYLPVWGALLVALILAAAFTRTPSLDATRFLNARAAQVSTDDVLRSALLLDEPGASG